VKNLRLAISIFLLLFAMANSYSQNKSITLNVKAFTPEDKAELDKAEELFSEFNYLQAIPIYESLQKIYTEEYYIMYRLGMCYLKKQDAYEKAVQYLKPVAKNRPNSADVKFYLGTAYHLTYQFDEAIKEFNEYLQQKIIKTQRPITERLIQYCENAKELTANPLDVNITNVGSPINTEASEYVPVISSDEQVMIFTYMGKKSKGGFEDIFSTEKKKNGEWKPPSPLGDNINGYDHDACIALSPDGQILFVYRDTQDKKGEIHYSTLKGKKWTTPKPLLGKINTKHWEGSASLSADGQTLYFTSDKPDGLGGRDIYKATLTNDSIWDNIENLGPTINTPYNDDAPFIHPDGRTLVFSSEGHNSMGGYDIFHSEFQKDGTWKTPINIGYPINSPDRDTYYVLSADGKTGYYSSGRPGGKGLQDIYTVVPGLEGYVPTIAMLKGKVTLNNEPAEAEIIITYKDNKLSHSKLGTNSTSGDYLTMLPTNNEYEIAYKLKNYDFSLLEGDSVRLETIVLQDVDTFVELNIDIPFYTMDYAKPDLVVLDTLKPEDVVLVLGDKQAEGLIFKVQIAAYISPENYIYKRLKGLGEVEKNVLDDGITRFTIGGNFNTFNEANIHNSKVVARGQDDAFVTAIYKGKRVYLRQLYELGILKR
jgi:hypothetical protein